MLDRRRRACKPDFDDESPGGNQAALGRVVIDADARAWLPAELARIASLFGDEAEL